MANCILGNFKMKVLLFVGIKHKFFIVGVHINDTSLTVCTKLFIFTALQISQNIEKKCLQGLHI